jgi:hypothetical protein
MHGWSCLSGFCSSQWLSVPAGMTDWSVDSFFRALFPSDWLSFCLPVSGLSFVCPSAFPPPALSRCKWPGTHQEPPAQRVRRAVVLQAVHGKVPATQKVQPQTQCGQTRTDTYSQTEQADRTDRHTDRQTGILTD